MRGIRAILEGLLSGQFYCPYSNRDVYEQLRKPEIAEAVNAALEPLGRTLATLGSDDDATAFFARYLNLSNPDDRKEASEELKRIRDQLMPVLDFIHLCVRSGPNETCLSPGDEVSFGELLSHVDLSLVAREQLRDLSVYPMFSRVKSVEANKEKLGFVMKAMTDAGYLAKKGSESTLYVATGKMAYIYQVMCWIADNQKLLPPEDDDHGPYQDTGTLL